MGKSYSHLSIGTTQNIDIEFKIASTGDRIVATIIDFLIVFTYYIFIAFTIRGTYPPLSILISVHIPIVFYHFLCEVFLGGQSIGKKVKKIKVIKVDGTRPSVVDYLARWLLSLVEILMTGGVVALITIIVSDNSQRLGDMLGKTTVIKLEKGIKLEDTIFVSTDESHFPVFPQARYLTDEDANMIREVLAKNNAGQQSYQVIDATSKLKNIYLKKLNIKSDLQPVDFLKTLLIDYNHQSGKV